MKLNVLSDDVEKGDKKGDILLFQAVYDSYATKDATATVQLDISEPTGDDNIAGQQLAANRNAGCNFRPCLVPSMRGGGGAGGMPPRGGTIYADPKCNAIVTPPGGRITGSPNGRFIQGRDANGNLTGARIDGGHPARTHPDSRGQRPHGHVPGVTNPDGTLWLPIY